jgi:hypothetical protein
MPPTDYRLIPPDAYKAVPWKNGRGTTTELARFPAEDPFRWRLSIADVVEAAPFSPFPGIDRSLLVLRGAGLRLDFADGEHVELTDRSLPFPFAGERALTGAPLAGPTRDFNVMIDRRHLACSVSSLWLGTEPLAVTPDLPGELLLYADQAPVSLLAGSLAITVDPDHLLHGPVPAGAFTLHGPGARAILVLLSAHATG